MEGDGERWRDRLEDSFGERVKTITRKKRLEKQRKK